MENFERLILPTSLIRTVNAPFVSPSMGHVEVGHGLPAQSLIRSKWGHQFGQNCMKASLINNDCPMCRAKLFPSPPNAAGDDDNIDYGFVSRSIR